MTVACFADNGNMPLYAQSSISLIIDKVNMYVHPQEMARKNSIVIRSILGVSFDHVGCASTTKLECP
ncbi:hypothetical protein BN2475_310158 [Paraburkholderia ribeironis]|uniref:Uncharacterized protein n=1 Tax=Paraburkholderia ribeironis TaxID=1247936 RepID=A0A1N7S2X5_9BURK|nr:hypothetical protein BN2475_310158 [Paraburkholderia ribeironis]